MPKYPDYQNTIESVSKKCPFRLVTAPAHNYLNSSFTETVSSKEKEAKPRAKIHPLDLIKLNLLDNEEVILGNDRGKVILHTESFEGLQQGVVVVEGIWPSEAFIGNEGINTLVGSDPVPPNGGAAFHDTSVWIKAYSKNMN